MTRRSALLVLLGTPAMQAMVPLSQSKDRLLRIGDPQPMAFQWFLDDITRFTIVYKGKQIVFTSDEIWKALQPEAKKEQP